MKLVQTTRPLWRTLSELHRSSTIVARPRQLSLLAGAIRSPLHNPQIQHIWKRWQSQTSTTLPAADREKIIAGKIETPTARQIENASASTTEAEIEKRDEPSYEITFTCKPCTTRSTHKISKQGYHHGKILITCPSCKNRHLICDNLKIFEDQNTNIEDILKKKGELVKRGSVGAGGDLEFWDEGTASSRDGSQRVVEAKAVPSG